MICGMPGPTTETTTIRMTMSGKLIQASTKRCSNHVDLAAEIASDDADDDRDDGGELLRRADDDREPRAVEKARKYVAAEIVGAEPELPARRLQPVDRHDLVEAVGRQHVGEDAGEQEYQTYNSTERAERLFAEQPNTKDRKRAELAHQLCTGGLRSISDFGHQRVRTLGSSHP